MADLRETIATRRRERFAKGIHDGYAEGYDDALCWVLDLIDGTARTDGPGGGE